MNKTGLGLVTLAFVLVVLFFGGCAYKTWGTDATVKFTVNKLERVQEDGDSKYLVFTDHGVFENTDTILRGKTDSSDLYNELAPGKTYICTVNGWRFSLFSMYRNLLSCDPA